MIRRVWSALTGRRVHVEHLAPSCTIVLTVPCIDQVRGQVSPSLDQGHESIVYFLGLTTGHSTLAIASILPASIATPGSVDVEARELGKVIESAAVSDLQVVGHLHTHPHEAYHSGGDLRGMQIRHPGYFSIVVPDYGAHLPSLQRAHVLMWTDDGFQEVARPVRLFEGMSS